MNRISLVGRLRTQKLLGRTVLILLASSSSSCRSVRICPL